MSQFKKPSPRLSSLVCLSSPPICSCGQQTVSSEHHHSVLLSRSYGPTERENLVYQSCTFSSSSNPCHNYNIRGVEPCNYNFSHLQLHKLTRESGSDSVRLWWWRASNTLDQIQVLLSSQ